ncbi:MAG: transcriptional repressor [Clostridium sp.]|nr:transcriptional repressor [Clostridium sp.]MBS5951146.1 transcriptional repressor [Clostridium sp.]
MGGILILLIDNIEKYLRDYGISPSYQRKRIFEYLYNSKEHPSVNEIYSVLIDEIPTLSKTTVYNTLNIFIEKKIVEAIIIDENELRYQILDVKKHGHFKCESCHTLYDIEIDLDSLNIDSLKGFDIHEQSLYFKGICKKCKSTN